MGAGIEAMKWCANAVAAHPGAVGYIPAIPSMAFALMLTGGIWLALWKTRLRLLGLVLALAGLAVAPWLEHPDVIVAQNGRLVAVRSGSGSLEAMPAKRGKFEIERWLEYDGDGRSAAEAQGGDAFHCDSVGCVAHVKGATVAVAKASAAGGDDCANADILVLDMPKPKDCARPRTIIDVFDVWRNGNAAIYVERPSPDLPPRFRVETVAAFRGERPWSQLPGAEKLARAVKAPQPTVVGQSATKALDSTTSGTKDDATPHEPRSAIAEDPGEEPSSESEDPQ
jgi:competence protein ComEC